MTGILWPKVQVRYSAVWGAPDTPEHCPCLIPNSQLPSSKASRSALTSATLSIAIIISNTDLIATHTPREWIFSGGKYGAQAREHASSLPYHTPHSTSWPLFRHISGMPIAARGGKESTRSLCFNQKSHVHLMAQCLGHTHAD
jgi:hypothetical protein